VAAVYRSYREIYSLHYFNTSTMHFLVVADFCLLDLYYCNIGPAQRQHQHKNCIYGHHTELLHETCSNVFMPVLHRCLFCKPNNWCWKSDKIHKMTFTSLQYSPSLKVREFQNRSHTAFCISLYMWQNIQFGYFVACIIIYYYTILYKLPLKWIFQMFRVMLTKHNWKT
jgi:hypothetical protein